MSLTNSFAVTPFEDWEKEAMAKCIASGEKFMRAEAKKPFSIPVASVHINNHDANIWTVRHPAYCAQSNREQIGIPAIPIYRATGSFKIPDHLMNAVQIASMINLSDFVPLSGQASVLQIHGTTGSRSSDVWCEWRGEGKIYLLPELLANCHTLPVAPQTKLTQLPNGTWREWREGDAPSEMYAA
jgi:hypothetical protein